MAVEALEKLKSSINRSVTAINVKTSSTLEKAKLKTQIDTIQNEVQRMMTAVGEAVYLMWQKEDKDLSKLDQHLEVIRQKKAEIAALEEEIAAIDQRNQQILGDGNTEIPVIAEAAPANICTACGTPCPEGAKFCRACGNKLIAE